MSFWQIVQPAAATNLITNPSPLSSTVNTGVTASGATIAFDNTLTRYGFGSWKLTPTANTFDGFYFTVSLTSGSTYYASCALYGAANVPYRIYFANNSGSGVLGTAGTTTGSGFWAGDRPVATYTAGSSGTFRVYVAKNSSNSTSPFWVDGAMLQTTGSGCTYIDGNQSGCFWNGSTNSSTSSRLATTRKGGQLVDLSTYGVAVQVFDGVGMPDLNNVILPYGLTDGGFYQRAKAAPRTLSLATNINTSLTTNASWQTLHADRQGLIDLMKSDLVPQYEPFWLRYTGTSNPVWIQAVYNSGLQARIGQAGFTEQPNIQMFCPDPFWYEEGTNVVNSAGSNSVSTGSGSAVFFQDINGNWSGMGQGLSGSAGAASIYAGVQMNDGRIMFVGSFSRTNGSSSANVAIWDPVALTWSLPGTGTNNTVRTIAKGPDGTIYIGGDFTTVNGITANGFAIYSTAGSWSAAVSGSNGINAAAGSPHVYKIAVGYDGTVYASGSFSTAGNVTTHNIAQWSNSTWSALQTGGSGTNGAVWDMVIAYTGNLAFVGGFTQVDGVTAYGSAYFDGTNFGALGASSGSGTSSGGSPTLYKCLYDSAGNFYASGSYYSLNGVVLHSIGVWNGTTWSPLGAGFNNGANEPLVDHMSMDINGNILTDWTTVNGLNSGILGPTVFNGTSWSNGDFQTGADHTYWATLVTSSGQYHMMNYASNFADNVGFPVISQVTPNGTASTPIKVTFTGGVAGGHVQALRNYTTGDTIYFNLDLLVGETAVLDLTPGNISFTSTFRGNVLGSVLPGSNLATFRLLPGTNYIGALYMNGTANCVSIQYKTRHWSIDGGS